MTGLAFILDPAGRVVIDLPRGIIDNNVEALVVRAPGNPCTMRVYAESVWYDRFGHRAHILTTDVDAGAALFIRVRRCRWPLSWSGDAESDTLRWLGTVPTADARRASWWSVDPECWRNGKPKMVVSGLVVDQTESAVVVEMNAPNPYHGIPLRIPGSWPAGTVLATASFDWEIWLAAHIRPAAGLPLFDVEPAL